MTNATDTNKTLGESMFAQCGYAQDAIDKRVSQVWHEIFEGPNKFYWENDEGLAYVMDTGNNDVRTEGMSYAMMIALQYDRKDVFDKLWGWVMRHMYMKDGHHAHYFAWSVEPDGTPNSNGPAPDGEEYFAMDLFLASRRWGDGEDIYEYSAWGREILRYCVHKGERYDGEPCGIPTTSSSSSFRKPSGAIRPTICRTSMKYSPKKPTKKTVHFGMRQPPQAVAICRRPATSGPA